MMSPGGREDILQRHLSPSPYLLDLLNRQNQYRWEYIYMLSYESESPKERP